MLRKRTLAYLLIQAIGAITLQTVAAEAPVGTPPPARSIREWMSNSAPATGGPVGSAPQAHSIREWKTTPTAATAPCPTATPLAFASATPAASPAVTPAVHTSAQKSPITISIKSPLREGNLVVVLDGVPIFNEKFRKPLLFVSQTTTWDPLHVAPGTHRLSAKVYGTKKTYLSADYDLNVSRTKATALRFVMQGDKLTVEVGSPNQQTPASSS